jgi:hypothetical protein
MEKRHDVRSRLSTEDTRNSGSRFIEYKVQPPLLLVYDTTSKEDEEQIRGT